ncbi:MAG: hypothetical protein AAGG45_01610 [Pseudomonadota bacterium]
MRIVEFTRADPDCWSLSGDRDRWGIDVCLVTEGAIEFSAPSGDTRVSLYLLEFLVEMKAKLLSNLGAKRFSAKIPLQFSGDGIQLDRDIDLVRIRRRQIVIYESDWNEFIQLFYEYEADVCRAMKEAFPKLSAAAEFQLLFGVTG